jgi:hypothetical protein
MNKMCKSCACLRNDCIGTNNNNWTNCIYCKTLENHNVCISAIIKDLSSRTK